MSMQKPQTALLLAGSVLLLALAGCNTRQDQLDRYIAEVKQRPADPIEPIPPVQTYTPFVYTVDGLRDPFTKVTTAEESGGEQSGSGEGPQPDFNRPKEYLEKFSLDTLSMVGTFNQNEFEWGLIRDPDEVIHRVAVGNYMGQNHGQVTSIAPDRMTLSEFVPDGAGRWLVREVSISIED